MNPGAVRRIEWGAAIALSCAILFLVVIRMEHAGALWRDECGVVQLARMPSVSEIMQSFPHEAFPPLFPMTIRLWTNLFGQSDIALRGYGLVVGLILIAGAWCNFRLLGLGVPLLSLGLIGLNSSFLIWGTTIRGYGLGSALILLAVGLIAGVLLRPSWPRVAAAFLVCLASVQCLLQNTVLLLAIGLSGAAVCLTRGWWKRAAIILGIGIVCLLSFLPFIGSYLRAREWDMVVKSVAPMPASWIELGASFGNVSPVAVWIGQLFVLTLVAVASWRLFVIARTRPFPEWDLLLFGLLLFITSIIGFESFLRILGYISQQWYYLALISVCAVAVDLLAAALGQIRWIQFGRLGFAMAMLLALPLVDWPKLVERQTNIDVIARTLQQNAALEDLILVNPWQLGISFNRYYHGQTPWLTLPPIDDHRIHRYDAFKAKMMSPRPISDVLERTGATLRARHRVWIVGGTKFPNPGKTPLSLPPAPDSQFGWDNIAYMGSWIQQMGAFIELHAVNGMRIPLPEAPQVNPVENVPLVVVQGWKD